MNLEDIKAPECFKIETELRQKMKIPVMHDDQHGTAIISSSALLNALEIIGKKIEDVKSDQAALSPADIQYKSGGTGFLLDVKGYVVTNAHVVDRARHIAVQGSDGKEHSARLVYFDKDRDIAILRINSNFRSSP